MSEDFTILLLSVGTRNKIVQYFKMALNGRGKVIVTDCSKLAPALYEGDHYYIVPKITEKDYLEAILSICKENNVKAVLSLIDPELSIVSKQKQAFLDLGVVPFVSDFEVVEMCFDKYKTVQFLRQHQFRTIRSYVDKEEFYKDMESGLIQYPVFVKPVKGSASINNNKVYSHEEIELLFSKFDHLIIQEFMDGTEYGVDAYIDFITGEPVGIFIKEKLKMRAGETDKAVSVKDPVLFDLVKRLVKSAGLKGVIDIDIFMVDDEYYVSEINPRFGGGYPHAFESGLNIPEMMINNVLGLTNENVIGCYKEGVYMMKYNEVLIK